MVLKGSETEFSLIIHPTVAEITNDLQNEDW